MNSTKAVLTLIIILGLLSACSPRPSSVVKVRPLDIHVVDASTKEPVSGAVVYYQLRAARNFGDTGWPLPSTEFREIMTERSRFYTDMQGNLTINERSVLLRPFELLYREYVYINLDIDPSPTPEHIDDFFNSGVSKEINPISALKGAVVTNHQGKGEAYVPSEGERYVYIDNWETFKKDKESVVVELERW